MTSKPAVKSRVLTHCTRIINSGDFSSGSSSRSARTSAMSCSRLLGRRFGSSARGPSRARRTTIVCALGLAAVRRYEAEAQQDHGQAEKPRSIRLESRAGRAQRAGAEHCGHHRTNAAHGRRRRRYHRRHNRFHTGFPERVRLLWPVRAIAKELTGSWSLSTVVTCCSMVC